MKRMLAALVFAGAAVLGLGSAFAQEVTSPVKGEPNAIDRMLDREMSQETLDLGMELVRVTGTSRMFDEVLPNVADRTKNAFIRANPQMQLGIIDMVDRQARDLVSRRRELDQQLARVWAAGFTDDELRELIAFYSTETGTKFARLLPQVLAVEMVVAEEWGRSMSDLLQDKVGAEIRASQAAERGLLQGDATAGPEAPAPVQ